eukprot:3582971-Karenia_brevis.AAC.1
MGFRNATLTALPAHLASLVLAEPKVEDLAKQAEWAGLLPAALILGEHRAAVDRAWEMFVSSLDAEGRSAAETLLSEAKRRASDDWMRVKSGLPAARSQAP